MLSLSKQSPVISVIVPVYNVQEYVGLCIDSVLKQTYKNIELILIDDGSKDESAIICAEYARTDSRVKFVTRNNNGVSVARNIGLEIARGDYVTFVDSDDVLNIHYIEALHGIARRHNSDIVSCKHMKFIENNEINNKQKPKDNYEITDKFEAILNLLYQRQTDNSVFAKLYRRNTVRKQRFNKKSSYSEDLEFNYKVFLGADKFVFTDSILYYYRNRPGSAVNSPYSSRRISGLKVAERIYYSSNSESKIIKKAAANKLFIKSSQLLPEIPSRLVAYRERCWKNIKEVRLIVIFDKRSKFRYRLYSFLTFFGQGVYHRVMKLKTKTLTGQNSDEN